MRYKPTLESLEDRCTPSVFFHAVTNESGDQSVVGSLPYAIFQADYVTKGTNYITFNIPGGANHTIHISQTLFLTGQTIIDGSTQPGWAGLPCISIQGTHTSSSIFYLGSGSDGSTIQWLDLYSYENVGITIVGSNNNWVQNNWIGFAFTPNGEVFNKGFSSAVNDSGIAIQASFNVVRGNVIAGTFNNIELGEDPLGAYSGKQYVTNSIQHNDLVLGDEAGIFLGAGMEGTWIGPDNLFAQNKGNGVELFHASDSGNYIFQNTIINNNLGVLICYSSQVNRVANNIISGNFYGGISCGTSGYGGSNANLIYGNIVGLSLDGKSVAGGSEYEGVVIQLGSTGNEVTGNVLCGSIENGVIISSSLGNAVKGNWIGENMSGTLFPNDAFGIALLANASYNDVSGNFFGSNPRGKFFIDPSAVGNTF